MRKVVRYVRKWMRGKSSANLQIPSFMLDMESGMRRRSYANYEAYRDHQREKLLRVMNEVRGYDIEYEEIVRQRYGVSEEWRGRTVLCLAARLGGEVRAFKSLGALAIGVDLEPGPLNPDVLYGDFHDINFGSALFDYVFCNAIDHVFDLNRLTLEIARVLKPDGFLLLEVCTKNPGAYESLDTTDVGKLIDQLQSRFAVECKSSMRNSTKFVEWEGWCLRLRKVGA